MLEEFVTLGTWWLPQNPQVVVPGKLSFSPENGVTLELYGSFYSSPFEQIGEIENTSFPSEVSPINENPNVTYGVPVNFIKPEESIILGLLVDNNEEVTLYRCIGIVAKFQFMKQRTTLSFNIESIFRNIHFKDTQDIKFKSISVQYSNLREWIGKSGIQVFKLQDYQPLICYQRPSNIHLATIDNLDLNITFSQEYLNPFDFYLEAQYYKINIEQKTYLTLQNAYNQPLDECIELLINFRDLLSFAMTKPSSIIEIIGKIDVSQTKVISQASGESAQEQELKEIKVPILFGLWNSAKTSKIEISTDKMLFLFSDVENNLGEIFEEWIKKRETYEPVFELLMTTMYTPNLYLHYKFLNIVQALEAYHTSKYEGIYQDAKVYEKGLYQEFKKVLKDFSSESVDPEKGISDEFRNALKGKLKSQTRFTLETRLKELLDETYPLLPNDFIGNKSERDSFANRAADTRNALTHHDKEKRRQAAQGKELFQLFNTLTVILQICLMKEINLPSNTIKTLVKRNRHYQDEWKPS